MLMLRQRRCLLCSWSEIGKEENSLEETKNSKR